MASYNMSIVSDVARDMSCLFLLCMSMRCCASCALGFRLYLTVSMLYFESESVYCGSSRGRTYGMPNTARMQQRCNRDQPNSGAPGMANSVLCRNMCGKSCGIANNVCYVICIKSCVVCDMDQVVGAGAVA